MFRNIWTIARRDFRAYFSSPIAYIVITAFLIIMGWMFYFSFLHFNEQNMQYQQHFAAQKGMSITDGLLRPLFGNMNVILLFLLPFVTMRLFAEEKRNHTLELLITSPITLWEIVLGKFFSAFLLLAVIMAFTGVYPVVLLVYSNAEWGPILTSYMGTLLLGSCYLSIGILCSSMTENQIVAGALTFALGLFFWLISWAAHFAGPVWGDVLMYLSMIGHFNNFSQGLADSSDTVFYFSFVGVGLFLTHRVLDSYRWR